ncbi:helix-turn-helix domain-containing protein [Streptomyces sp. YGL11-2]|uniref:helix-turn-helix domain-containing protein n=1 Tax=Streptomyces sp. YGL11-2 TaxID=3414028 RepID=UPI003CF19B14
MHIADRLRAKASLRQIDVELGRSPLTINRELRRNRYHIPEGSRVYRPHAQRHAEARRPRPKHSKTGQPTSVPAPVRDMASTERLLSGEPIGG